MKTNISIIAASVLLSSCAGLSLTPEGEKIRILDPSEVGSCRELGKTNTSVTDTVVGVERPEGDTIVPLTVIEQGQQTFVVYKCVNPDG
jgi:hypothetical protein